MPNSCVEGSPEAATKLKSTDMHVHVVGNGSGGSGCWLRMRGPVRKLMAGMMLKHIGLPASALEEDLETQYIARLLEQLRSSSLGRAIILAQDLVHDDGGRPLRDLGSFYVPNDYVLGLARNHSEFLPAVSIHPARKDALAELDRCVEGGAVMMKCLPNCQNINCNDPRYKPFWAAMAAAGLPLLAHTGGEHTLPVVRPAYADPRILKLPLDCGVTVIAAHAATQSAFTDPEYFHVLAEMMREYPNLYADNSAFNVPFRGRHTRRCIQPPLVERMVHGSDYPVPVNGVYSWLRGFISWKTFWRWQRQPNVLERDYQLKRAMGFPPESFTRICRLLRPRG